MSVQIFKKEVLCGLSFRFSSAKNTGFVVVLGRERTLFHSAEHPRPLHPLRIFSEDSNLGRF